MATGLEQISSIIGIGESLFGGTTSVKGTTSGTASSLTEATSSLTGEDRKRLELDEAAITSILEELLSGPDGLASIFAGEQNAGIFNSSVSAQAAGNLSAKIVGELARLTAEEVSTTDRSQTETQLTTQEKFERSRQSTKDEGLLSSVGDFFGF